jgi:hypothetical protein
MDMILREVDEIDYTKIDFSPIRHLSGGPRNSVGGAVMINSTTSTDDDGQAGNDTENEASIDEVEVTTPATSVSPDVAIEDEGEDADDEDDEGDEEPVVYEVAAAVQPVRTAVVTKQVLHAKCSLVTIPKRVPPPLPIRSPARMSRSSKSELGDVSMLKSPLRQSFNSDERSQTAPVSTEHQESDAFSLELATEIRPGAESPSHKHADSQESIATEVAFQATPTATVYPQIPSAEAAQIEEPTAEKKPTEESDLSAKAEIMEAEAMKVEAPVMAAATITVS